MGRRGLWWALGAVLGLTGCPQGTTPFNDPAALVVAMHSGFTEQVVAAAEPWQEAHPEVKLSLAPYQPRDFQQAITPRLLTATHVPDVLVVDAAFVAGAGQGGLLEDLSAAPYTAGPLLEGFPGAVVAQARAPGKLVAVPADVAPTLLFYRKDLLDRAGVPEAELTRSWSSFIAACGKVRAATSAYCLPRVHELAELVLQADVPSGQSIYFSPSGEPLADEARFERAFTLARAAEEAKIAAGPVTGSEQWVELVRRGFFAAILGGPTTIRRLEVLSPGTAGQWRMAPLPGGARVPAPSAFCALSAAGSRKARAWELVQQVCLGKHNQLQGWRKARAYPALPAAAASPALDEPVPFLGGQVVGPMLRAASAGLPVPRLQRLDAFARDAVGMEMDYVLEEGKDFREAMGDARARIRRQLERGRKR